MVITVSFDAPSSFSTTVSKSSTSNSSNSSWKTIVQPSLSFYTIEVDAVRGQPGLIHSSQLMFDVPDDCPSGLPTCEIPQDIIPPDHSLTGLSSRLRRPSPW